MEVVYIPQLEELSFDGAAAPYRFIRATPENGRIGLVDRAVTRCELPTADALTVVFPPARTGRARDFFARLVVTSLESPEISFVPPPGETISFEDLDPEILSCSVGVNLFAFTETDAGIFIVNRRQIDVDVEVSFDPCGGTVDETTRTYKLGAAYAQLPTPHMDGMVFEGWYTASEGGVRIAATDRCKTTVTRLYAQWSVYVDPYAPVICPVGNLVFYSDGDAAWQIDDLTYATEPGSARSGWIGDNGSTTLRTTATGRGVLSFMWRASSETSYDALTLYVDGCSYAQISGHTDWEGRSVEVENDGPHVFEWRYAKDASCSEGEDCAWLDEVSWTPSEE